MYPMPNSSRFVLPAMIAPAARSRVTTVASYGLVNFLRLWDPHVVGYSVVQILSLRAMRLPFRANSLRSVDYSKLNIREISVFCSLTLLWRSVCTSMIVDRGDESIAYASISLMI